MPLLAPPNRYKAAADLIQTLPLLISGTQSDLPVKAKAQAIGVSTATLQRLYSGGHPTQPTILKLLRWLSVNS